MGFTQEARGPVMSAKHTPGPWNTDRQNWPFELTGRYHRVISEERFPAAFIPAWSEPGPGEVDGTEEAKANAHLISAAPDLLEALKTLVGPIWSPQESADAVAKACAAIAKAEGAQS